MHADVLAAAEGGEDESTLAALVRAQIELGAYAQAQASLERLTKQPVLAGHHDYSHLAANLATATEAPGAAVLLADAAKSAPAELRRLYRLELVSAAIAAKEWDVLAAEFSAGLWSDQPGDVWMRDAAAARAFLRLIEKDAAVVVPESIGAQLHGVYRRTRELVDGIRTKKGERLASSASAPSFARDGSKVAYAVGFPSHSRIDVLDVASGETSTFIARGSDPVWSPDGTRLAYCRVHQGAELPELIRARGTSDAVLDASEIWVHGQNSGSRRLTRGSSPSWSADGSELYYYHDGALRAVKVDGSGEPRLIASCEGKSPAVSWSAESWVDSVRGTAGRGQQAEIHVKEIASGQIKGVWQSPSLSTDTLISSWSPDDAEVAVSAPPGHGLGLWVFNLTSLKSSPLLAGDSMVAEWAPDRSRLLVALGAPYWEIWSVPLEGSPWTDVALGTTGGAVEFFQREVERLTGTIAAEPENYEAIRQRARLRMQLRDYENAYDDFTKAAEGLPDQRALFLYRRGQVREAQSLWSAAIDEYTAALAESPQLPGAYRRRGPLYLRTRQYHKAVEDYAQLTELAPDQPKYFEEIAKIHLNGPEEINEPGRALLAAEQAVALDPGNGRYRMLVAASYYQLGDYEQAIEYLHRALEVDDPETQSGALGLLSWIHVMGSQDVRDPEKAIAYATRARKIAPEDNIPIHDSHLGLANYRKGEFKLSEVQLDRAFRARDTAKADAFNYFSLAAVNAKLRRDEMARRYFKRAQDWMLRHRVGAFEGREIAQLEDEARAAFAEAGLAAPVVDTE